MFSSLFSKKSVQGLMLGVVKPAPCIQVEIADPSGVKRMQGEDPGVFNKFSRDVNFLMEMMKFFPKWYVMDMLGETFGREYIDAAFEFGNARQYAFAKDGTIENINSPWGDGTLDGIAGAPGRDWAPESFGSWHDVEYPNAAWSKGKAVGMQKTLDFYSSASTFNHFKNKTISDADQAVGVRDLKGRVYGEDYTSIPELSLYWDDAKAYLSHQYGDKTYYQTWMAGMTGLSNDAFDFLQGSEDTQDRDGDGKIDGQNHFNIKDPSILTSQWTKDYDGIPGKGGFLFMVGMLESRRRIDLAMTNIFGAYYDMPTWDATTDPANPHWDDNYQAMISNFDTYTKGLSEHHIAQLEVFLSLQHHFEYILKASVGGTTQYSGRDRVATEAFSNWLSDQKDAYRQHFQDKIVSIDQRLGIEMAKDKKDWGKIRRLEAERAQYKKERANIDKIWAEYIFSPISIDEDITIQSSNANKQPYAGISWANYSPAWTHDNATGNRGNFPTHINPRWVEHGGSHPELAIGQVLGLNGSERKGHTAVLTSDGTPLYWSNWAAHAIGRVWRGESKAAEQIVEGIAFNQRNQVVHSRKTREYEAKLSRAEDDQHDLEVMGAKAESRNQAMTKEMQKRSEQKALARKNELQKMEKARQNPRRQAPQKPQKNKQK